MMNYQYATSTNQAPSISSIGKSPQYDLIFSFSDLAAEIPEISAVVGVAFRVATNSTFNMDSFSEGLEPFLCSCCVD